MFSLAFFLLNENVDGAVPIIEPLLAHDITVVDKTLFWGVLGSVKFYLIWLAHLFTEVCTSKQLGVLQHPQIDSCPKVWIAHYKSDITLTG